MFLRQLLCIVLVSSYIPSCLCSSDPRAVLGTVERIWQSVAPFDFIKKFWRSVARLDVVPDPPKAVPLLYEPSLQIPNLTDVEHFVHFAAASFCHGRVLSRFTCKECKLLGRSVKLVQVIRNRNGGTLGFVSVDNVRREIVVAYRGTNNLANLIQDLAYAWLPSPRGDGTRMHKGFYAATMSIYPRVLKLLRHISTSHYPKYKVVLTGHSLGGAMATISYYLLSHDMPNLSYVLITFGEPRVGDRAFADYINQQRIPAARVVNGLDAVPHVSVASLGFVHHLTEFWTTNGTTRICGTRDYEDLTCSASRISKDFNAIDHLTYLGTAIGLNCIEENPTSFYSNLLTG